MRRLHLLRHAAAVAKDAAADLDRVLGGRGRDEMAAVAAYLDREGIRPDLALVSPAARTRETWQRTGLPDVETRFIPGIYEASAEILLDTLRAEGGAAGQVILVGHNPGVEELGNRLVAGEAGPGAFPTAALLTLAFEAGRWADLAFGTGRLHAFESPATMGAG